MHIQRNSGITLVKRRIMIYVSCRIRRVEREAGRWHRSGMIQELIASKQLALLPLGEIIAGLVWRGISQSKNGYEGGLLCTRIS
jgi:hypothetical protein